MNLYPERVALTCQSKYGHRAERGKKIFCLKYRTKASGRP